MTAADRLADALGAAHRPPSIADGTVSTGLVDALRLLGASYGALGVARTAAELADGATFHLPGEGCTVPLVPAARATDPGTSRAAAVRALPRARTVGHALLLAYARLREIREDDARRGLGDVEHDGLNRDEAIRLAEHLTGDRLAGAWRRVSELAALGLIEPVRPPGRLLALTREGMSGRDQVVYALTDRGADLLARLGPYVTPARR